MEKFSPPEQYHLPDTQIRVAELRGELQDMEASIADAKTFLAEAHERHAQEQEYLKDVEDRLAKAESGEDNILTPEELRVLREETLTYVEATKQRLESFQRVLNDLAAMRRRYEQTIAERLETDRRAGRLGNPGRPVNKA